MKKWLPRVLVALGLALLVVIPVLLVTDIDVPGPNVRDKLGLEDDEITYVECTPDPARDLTPDAPPAAAGRWRREANAPAARDELKAVEAGGLIYIFNGHSPPDANGRLLSTTDATAFDPKSGKYHHVPETPAPLDHAVAVEHRGDIYLTGGYSNGIANNRLWRYSPEQRRWSRLKPMKVARFSPAGEVIGDKFYVVAGAPGNENDPYRSMEVYDFTAGHWSAGPNLPTARHHVASTALDGKLYVAGGRKAGDFSLDAFERFDPKSNSWEQLPPLPQGSGGLELVSSDDEVIAIAGGDDMENWVTGAVWAFSPDTDRWRRLPNLRISRHGHAAAVANGRIYVFQGAPCPGFGRSSSVESLPVR